MKYRHLGKEQALSLGRYPDVALKEARAGRDHARKLLATGKNPAFEKKRAAVAASVGAADTFLAIAEELIAKREREGLKVITTGKARWLLSLLTPDLGKRPIAEIEPFELLSVLKKVETSGRLETAKRLLAFAGRVFRYGVATTRARRNIAADLQGALVAPKVTGEEPQADLLDTLKEEHELVSGLLKKLVDSDRATERKSLLKQIKANLVPHVRAEEKVLYDAIIAVKDKDAQRDGEEGYIEHSLADRMLAKLEKTANAMSPEFSAGAKVLRELVEHHIKEEESAVWSDAKANFSTDERKLMNQRFLAEKKKVRVQ